MGLFDELKDSYEKSRKMTPQKIILLVVSGVVLGGYYLFFYDGSSAVSNGSSETNNIISPLSKSLPEGYYYISEMGSDHFAPEDKDGFGFRVEKNGKTYNFIPVAFSKDYATEVKASELSYSVSIDEGTIELINQMQEDNTWSLEFQNNILSGTVTNGGNSYNVILQKHPIADIVLIDENSVYDADGNLIREDEIKDLEWIARMNLGDNGALRAIANTLGMEIYRLAKKDKDLKAVRVSLYYKDLIDKYGHDIPWKEAYDSTFIVDGLDEVRKYKDGLAYALEYESSLAYFIVSGEYSYLWK